MATTLSIVNASTGLTCTWTTGSHAGGSTARLVSAPLQDMGSLTIERVNQALNSNTTLVIAKYTPRFYRLDIMLAGSVIESSPVTYSVSTGDDVSPLATNPNSLQMLYEVVTNQLVVDMRGGAAGPEFGSCGGSDATAISKLSPTPTVPYNKLYTNNRQDPNNLRTDDFCWRVGSGGAFTVSVYGDGYEACCNSLAYRQAQFDWIDGVGIGNELAFPVFGVFWDNGWAGSTTARSICSSTGHVHYSPGETCGISFGQLLVETTCKILEKNPNALIIVNGGMNLAEGSIGGGYTGAFIHGYDPKYLIGGYSWEGPMWKQTGEAQVPDFATYLSRGIAREAQALSSFVEWYAFEYITPVGADAPAQALDFKDKAFYSYAGAKLFAMPWCANTGENGNSGHKGFYPLLTSLRLGTPDGHTGGGVLIQGCRYRSYANGFTILNPTDADVVVILPLELQKPMYDVYNDANIGALPTLTVLAGTGRVYVYRNVQRPLTSRVRKTLRNRVINRPLTTRNEVA